MKTHTLPPYISTAESDWYAHDVIKNRHTRIVEQVIKDNPVDDAAIRRLRALARECREGVITSPLSDGCIAPGSFEPEELRTWHEQIAVYEGRSWFDVPWFFAEALYYMKLLVAFGFYAREGARGRDPYHAQKEKELVEPHGGLDVARQLLGTTEKANAEEKLVAFMRAALWGNRVDLGSFEMGAERRKDTLRSGSDSLLVDHTSKAVAAIMRARNLQFILDNAGPELVCDLLLADHLLSGRAAVGAGPSTIVFQAKKAPFLVSDSIIEDVQHTIDLLASDSDARVSVVGTRLHELIRAGRLVIKHHWFWNSALHFTAFPADLRDELGRSDLLLLKGDANYRRILEDRRWDTSLSLDDLASYFPAPFVSLRTLKSEVIVDVPTEEEKQLTRADPLWRLNGTKGLIRYCGVGR